MKIQVPREDLLRQIGYREPPQPKLLRMADEMIGVLEGLVEPQLAFKAIQSEEDLPPFLIGAVLKYVGAATLGPKLENKVKDLFDEGRPAEAYVLDTAGSVAVTKAGDILWDEIRQEAAAKGFRKGLRRTPGCLGIDMAAQQWIFERLAHPELGITLTPSFMMVPRKSISFLARFDGKLGQTFSCKGCPQYPDCTLRL